MAKRKRRSFSKEYKAEVVELIRKSGRSIGAVARDLDLSETAVRRWVHQAEIDSGGGPAGALTTAEREELAQLRKRVKTLEMEREILKNGLASATRPAGTETLEPIPLPTAEGAAVSLLVLLKPVKKHGPGVAADF
jgi:transposase